MKTFKIVNETACIMIMDENKQLEKAYFINEYTFSSFTKKQKESLVNVLSSENIALQELWQHEDHTLYLSFIDIKRDKQVTAEINNNGSIQYHLTNDLLHLTDDPNFLMVVDFTEKTAFNKVG